MSGSFDAATLATKLNDHRWAGRAHGNAMRDDTLAAIRKRFATSRNARARIRRLVADGKANSAEEDRTRNTAFIARMSKALGTPESIIDTNDFQPASFLPDGATARRAVARVLVQTATESRSGSGFLISPELFITNQHVVNNVADARSANLYFDDELDHSGLPAQRTVYNLAPDNLALFSDENRLDYAIVAIGEKLEGSATPDALGACPLNFTPDRHRIGMNANIIQHPEGMPKRIAIRNNLLTDRTDTRLLYETDTDVGSSGSPVLNDQWDVIALHHYGQAEGNGNRVVNEGVRISAIYQDLQQRAEKMDAQSVSRALLERALALWTDTSSAGRKLEHRPPPQSPAEAISEIRTPPNKSESPMSSPTGTVATLTVPLEVTIRIPDLTVPAVTPHQSRSAAPQATTKRLITRSESTRLDTDYGNRNGFDASFITGATLDLSKVAKPAKAQIALLQDGGRSDGRLDYQNFSLIMHKARRFALLTATNIDGPSYVKIVRATGLPADQTEADTWYKDSRINDALTVGNDFYVGWGHYFDRGHLTRREDPNWGKFAVRANADTFHFTNCTPQHWLFNESTEYWQGIEQYILEKGLVAIGKNNRLSVLQGPVFDDENDQWADDVQVPSAFWKIVVWKGQQGMKAVAMIADQTALLSIERGSGQSLSKKYSEATVSQYQSSIVAIEKKTGLDLSSIRAFDTTGQALPTVGEKAALITKWTDIRL